MYKIVVMAGLALTTLGGAYGGTVVPINLAAQQGGTATCGPVTNGSCTPPTVSSTGTTFETTLFSGLDPSSSAPTTPSTSASTPPDGPGSYIFGAESNNNDAFSYAIGGTNSQGAESLLVDLGTCSGATAFTTLSAGSCGLPDADYLYSMIQAGGAYGTQGITVTAYGVNGSGEQTDSFTLTAGVDYRESNSGQTGVNCTIANTVTSGTCAGTTDTKVASAQDPNNSNITVFNNVYGAQTASSKNYYVDIQQFSLGSFFQGGYIDQVLIQFTTQSSGLRAMTLSGVSVDETPEPGTIVMFGIGLGLIAFWKLRARRASQPTSVQ